MDNYSFHNNIIISDNKFNYIEFWLKLPDEIKGAYFIFYLSRLLILIYEQK